MLHIKIFCKNVRVIHVFSFDNWQIKTIDKSLIDLMWSSCNENVEICSTPGHSEILFSASGQLAGWEVKILTYELFPPLPCYHAKVSGVHDIPRSQQLPLLSSCHTESSYFLLSHLFYEHCLIIKPCHCGVVTELHDTVAHVPGKSCKSTAWSVDG